MRDGLGNIDRVLARDPARTDPQSDVHERAGEIREDEDDEAHSRFSGGEIEQRGRHRYERREHDGPHTPPFEEAFPTGEPPPPARIGSLQVVDDPASIAA